MIRLITISVATCVLFAAGWATADDVPDDHFPNLGFTVLDQDERREFIEVSDTELCPCPGTPRTLSACLIDEAARCSLAEEVSSLMMRALKEGGDADGVRDQVVRFITEAQTPREFDLGQAFALGNPDARVQIVVFSDFECPFCRAFSTTIGALSEQYGDQVVIYYKHFPLPQHANALPAARAAIAAGQQGKFWEMHDLLFENQARLQNADQPMGIFLELVGTLSLDRARFTEDFDNSALAAIPGRDREEGRLAGVNSTPTCYINGIKFRADETLSALRTHIDGLLAE